MPVRGGADHGSRLCWWWPAAAVRCHVVRVAVLAAAAAAVLNEVEKRGNSRKEGEEGERKENACEKQMEC